VSLGAEGDVEVAAALYAAAQLEEIGVLRLCDRLVELYLRGGLPVAARGPAAVLLDAYWLGRAERLPEQERRALYALGPGYDELLGRLAAALSAHANATAAAAAADAADVASATRELRASISTLVDDDARAVVPIMHDQLADALSILSDPEILQAYGARDPWQLADHLARLELGGTPDVVRHQALAAAATVVLAWLEHDGRAVTEGVVDAAEAWLTAAATPSG
jgi:hypothetical protein